MLEKHQKLHPTFAGSLAAEAIRRINSGNGQRPGQAIYHLLPGFLSCSSIEIVDHYKWYESHDLDYCLNYFYEHYVHESYRD